MLGPVSVLEAEPSNPALSTGNKGLEARGPNPKTLKPYTPISPKTLNPKQRGERLWSRRQWSYTKEAPESQVCGGFAKRRGHLA